MTLPVAVLAGGQATRLYPLTATLPKALVDVAGKPFIVRQLDYLQKQGVTEVVLCLSYRGEQVVAVVGDGAAFGLKVRYSWDGRCLMGTGGALRQALPLLGQNFFVLYGDSYLPVDYGAVERSFFSSGKSALMTVLHNNNLWDTSNVLYRDGCIAEYNKRMPNREMAHIDYGLGVLSSSVLKDVPACEPSDLSDVYHELSIRGALAGYEISERFYEIGSRRGLQETINYFKKGELG